jgi:serine/threonine protein kinase
MRAACCAGDDTPLTFTPAYAAPEVAKAYETGADVCVAHPAADVWALGLIAFRLLTRRGAFPASATHSEVFDALAGRAPLPWEDPAATAACGLDGLCGLKAIVLRCLSRAPEDRPSVGVLLQECTRLLDAATMPITAGVTQYGIGGAKHM